MKERKHKFRRWISLLTVWALIACVIPLTSTAEPAQEKVSGGFVDMADVPENIRVLLTSKDYPASSQTRASRTGMLEDTASLRIVDTDDLNSIWVEDGEGNGTAHIFAVPVRYETEDGKTAFIDTSMTAENFIASLMTGYSYRSTANSFSLQYAKKPTDGWNMDGNFTLAVDNPYSLTLPDGIVDLTEEGNGRITYSNAFGEHTSLACVNMTTGVKEAILLEDRTDTNRFSFIFRSNTHQPVLSADGTAVAIVNKSHPDEPAEYVLSSLYAYDSFQIEEGVPPSEHKHFTEDGYYEIFPQEDGSYRITAIVPEAFLNHPETVYPVTVEPILRANASGSNIEDSYIAKASPNANYGSAVYLRFGNNGGLMHSYVKFKTLGVPSYADITSATLELTFRSGQTSGGGGTCSLVGSAWSENSITWNTAPSIVGGTATTSGHNNFTKYSFNAIGFVNIWHKNPGSNYGVRFGYSDTTLQDYNSVVSSEGEAHRAPKLTINYNAVTKDLGTITARGESVAGSNLFYTFTISSSATYIFETSRPNGSYGESRDTVLELRDTSGKLIASNDNISSTNKYSKIQISLSPGKYKIYVKEAPNKTSNVFCYLTLYKKDELVFEATEYASLCYDFVKIGNADPTYNCYAYAIGLKTWINPGSLEQTTQDLKNRGYTKVDHATSNCVVAYGTTAHVTHLARIDNGVVTAKLGGGEVVRHSNYSIYYSQGKYGSPVAYYVKS